MNTFETAIAIRAYSERPGRKPLGSRPLSTDIEASEWTLVFDCETTIDATQQLRVGFYQIRHGDDLDQEGVFFDSATITCAEEEFIRDYAKSRDLKLLTIAEFRSEIFLKYGYTRCGTLVGFNLPFDLSRIALDHASAREHMRGGFTFALSKDSDDPRVRVKHLSPRAALLDFATPGEQDTPRGMRNRDLKVKTFRGHFVDVKTIAVALLSRSFTLRSLAEFLEIATRKHETDEHGEITIDYLDYARADVQVTWECFHELRKRYSKHRLSRPISKLLSEASIGKAYLQEMGITPFLGCDPDFSREQLGEILCAYYGGRAEVRNRRVICETIYCDFKSMYPTVNSLMGLWEFVTADGMTTEDTTAATRTFLEAVTLDDLQRPTTWRKLCTLVRLTPDQDLFPVRAEYNGETYTIGLNYLTTEEPLWFTLADCIVSKLLTGKIPEIEIAMTYRPGPLQTGLKPVEILGKSDYRVDPANDDLFTRLIDLRDEAKEKNDPIEKTLKIIANSTSYGIFIEVNRNNASKSKKLNVFGPNGGNFQLRTKAIEDPGKFFNPILGVLITGAARLILGIAENKVIDLGLDWAFCDTDSLAIIRPQGISRKKFYQNTQKVIDWFEPLNPYRKPGSILKIEAVNDGIKSKKPEPLYCFAISSKRYALFNLDCDGNPILRKASAHGLGHLIAPYDEEDAPSNLPSPRVPLTEIGVKHWQHDLWLKIIQAALDGTPNQVALDWHPTLFSPAALRYTASSPQLLAWLKSWNDGKPYEDQVRPFGFLLSFMARTGVFAPTPCLEESVVDKPKRGRPRNDDDFKPIAPYDSDPVNALPNVFDRVTGEWIAPEQLKTYAEALFNYHLSPEDKFENANYFDRGRTERRQVVATGFVLIGKEANQVGESGEPDPVVSAVEEFTDS